MIKKEILIGFVLGLISNTIGLFIVCLIIGYQSENNNGVYKILNGAISENFIGKLISLGAIINLLCFFYLLKKNNDNKAAGVLFATIFIALLTFLIKL